ncbi:coiled-coil domain-containing protein 30-like [Psammomys obesus]|uniref:coiled-coil domain-containing protein 30-like n=1 Tax=Psammomys obesus TaxID=48139 RepID=UPI002452F96D|nr:coiled-coil domain-containing protein 30-like [Psammomys obesus]
MCQEGLSRLALSSTSKQSECSVGERRTLAGGPELVDSTLGSRRHLSSSLQKESPQHRSEDLAEEAAPQNCLLREVEGIAQRLETSLEEIRRVATEPREEEKAQRKLGDALENARLEIERLKDNLIKLKESGTADLQKAKEHNQRLDEEILALRNRVRSLDSEKKVLGEMVVTCFTS